MSNENKIMAADMPVPPFIEAWRAGHTKRWHAHPELCNSGDCVSAHSARMATLALSLFTHDTLYLLVHACLVHDLGEACVGDVRGPAKRVDPVLAERLDVAEGKAMARMSMFMPPLDELDRARLKLLDHYDAFLWVRFAQPDHLALPNWQVHIQNIIDNAYSLGFAHDGEFVQCLRRSLVKGD